MKTLFTGCRLPLSGGSEFCVGGEAFCPARPPYGRVRDLHGACVLPAFPDAHSHLLAYALSLLQTDGSGCRTEEDLLRLIESREGAGLLSVRDATVLPRSEAFERFPRPVQVQLRSGHAGAFNAAARRLLGIAQAQPVLEEEAYLAAARRVPPTDEREVLSAFLRAQADYLVHGMTTAQEGWLQREMFPLYEMLLRDNALLADVVAYPSPDDYEAALARFAGARRFFVGGMKIFLDGSPQQRTAFLRQPYAGGGCGAPAMREEEVLAACRFAAKKGAQLLANCNGDGAVQCFSDALARLTHAERRAIRPVLLHAQIVGEDQFARLKKLGVTLSFFPAHVLYWGDVHIKNLGPSRAERISPARSALLRGIPFTLHQDTPVCPPDPLEAARCAVLRETSSGKTFPAEAIAPRDALEALTKGAARQYGFSDRGEIAPGKRADFVLLDGDPLRDIRGARVRETWLRGQCVFRAEQ